ncbi:MAG TPA: hypothetical protein VJU78_06670 [Chitinophagaceae bacterium]|nr:hypothetical protein [Chitinophagaceae bacterium]
MHNQPQKIAIQFFCPRWGQEHETYDAFCRKVKEAAYDGIEAPVPFDAGERKEQVNALAKYDLLLLGQYYQSFEKDFATHTINYEKHLRHLLDAKPVKIDSQTGKDYFSLEQNKELFELAKNLSAEYNIPIAHETHRNKALFAAHSTKFILERVPDLPITADFSHWCAVAESLLEDQEEATALACRHAIHIHARVGHEEGPQVIDPRAPEWEKQVHAHLQWWDAIIAHQQKSGASIMTITPEFGPLPYMPSVPYTRQPLASQWEINIHMMQLLKKRYQ